LERRLAVTINQDLKGLNFIEIQNKINQALKANKIDIFIVSAIPSKIGKNLILITGTGYLAENLLSYKSI